MVESMDFLDSKNLGRWVRFDPVFRRGGGSSGDMSDTGSE